MVATDYIRAHMDQIRADVPGEYVILGTDGFGRSDSRVNLRDFFEVDSRHIVYAALGALVKAGTLSAEVLDKARVRYELIADKTDPMDA